MINQSKLGNKLHDDVKNRIFTDLRTDNKGQFYLRQLKKKKGTKLMGAVNTTTSIDLRTN